MVSYFYQASYDCSKYTTSESLLHAQVAILADKYVCPSLYDLARTSFLKTIENVDSGDWGIIAAFIYDFTTTEAPAHIELRDIVVGAVAGRHSVFQATLQNPKNVELLRQDVDDDSVLQRRAEFLQIHFRVAYMQLSIPLICDCTIHGSLQMLLWSVRTGVLNIVSVIMVIGDWLSSLVQQDVLQLVAGFLEISL
jgi:hypothetical protein